MAQVCHASIVERVRCACSLARMKHVAIASIVFVVGCAVGGAASQFVVPAARAGSDAPKWEYNCGFNATKAQLDEAGVQGWDLVSTTVVEEKHLGTVESQAIKVQYCFKRPM
jgi:hypothetical protein